MDAHTKNIRKRYDRIAPVFNSMDRMVKEEWRKQLLQNVRGRVLEVGVGTGKNLPYYPANSEVTGIDFSPGMLSFAYKKAEESPADIQLLEMDAQQLQFKDHSFDTVVSTCVFCSVPDAVKGLQEIRRVLKPGGKLLMIEHMLSDRLIPGLVLQMINPVVVRIVGANVNRKTLENIRNAGFSIEDVQNLAMGDVVRRIVAIPR